MKTRLSTVFSLVVLVSMLLAACGTVTTVAPTQPPAPTATQPPVAAATNTTAPQPTAVPPTPTATAVPPQIGGWLDQMVYTKSPDLPSAVAQLQAGAIDVYAFSGTDAQLLKTIKADSNLTYVNTYGAYKQMMLNWSPCADKNILNPFQDMAIREAMNWAFDRNYVTQEIMGGLGVPKYTVIGASADAARFAPELAAVATTYAYNLDKAKEVVNTEMPKLGATLGSDGKWQFNGKPVTIIGIIRTEDARKQIGDYFGTQLEALGFTVDRQFKTSKEASPIWQGDVTQCKFNFYTAGWVATSISRDDGPQFKQWNDGTDYGIPIMSGHPSADLAAAEDALYLYKFTSMDQRAQLMRTAIDLSMKESWWGFMVDDDLSYYPSRAVTSYSPDLSAGPTNRLWGYTAKFTDKTGGSMRVANANLMNDPWNAVFGSNWVFDYMPKAATEDYAFVYDPFTGLRVPKLATKLDIVAETGLPIGKSSDFVSLTFQDKITVPDDAWADWDAAKQVFISAKDRAAADPNYKQEAKYSSTVTYSPDLFKTKWHDGSTFSVADVVMDIILTFDPGKEASKIYDSNYNDSVTTPMLSHLKGIKIVSTDPLTITTWDDSWGLDAENMGYSWYPSENEGYKYGTAPWDALVPGILGETDGKMAFDQVKAEDKKVDWTSVVSGPTLEAQAAYLDQLVTSGDIPYAPTMSQYVTADQAKARYTNLQAYYKAHNNLWVGTGPYFVDKVDTTAVSVTTTKFADYMFPVDQWAAYAVAPLPEAKVDGPAQVAAGTEGDFTLGVTFQGNPYPSKNLTVSYTLFGSDGSVAATGDATLTAEGQYAINLTSDVTNKLPAGAAKLSIAVVSNLVAIPTFVTAQFVVAK
jgi:peptide/nickel transport system substrate-binding protein